MDEEVGGGVREREVREREREEVERRRRRRQRASEKKKNHSPLLTVFLLRARSSVPAFALLIQSSCRTSISHRFETWNSTQRKRMRGGDWEKRDDDDDFDFLFDDDLMCFQGHSAPLLIPIVPRDGKSEGAGKRRREAEAI